MLTETFVIAGSVNFQIEFLMKNSIEKSQFLSRNIIFGFEVSRDKFSHSRYWPDWQLFTRSSLSTKRRGSSLIWADFPTNFSSSSIFRCLPQTEWVSPTSRDSFWNGSPNRSWKRNTPSVKQGQRIETRFLCEVRVPTFPYAGVGNSTSKKDAEKNASRDFVQFLVRQGRIRESDVPGAAAAPPPSVVDGGGGGSNNNWGGPPMGQFQPQQPMNMPIQDAYRPYVPTAEERAAQEKRVEEAEDVDMNAMMHGNWTIEKCQIEVESVAPNPQDESRIPNEHVWVGSHAQLRRLALLLRQGTWPHHFQLVNQARTSRVRRKAVRSRWSGNCTIWKSLKLSRERWRRGKTERLCPRTMLRWVRSWSRKSTRSCRCTGQLIQRWGKSWDQSNIPW